MTKCVNLWCIYLLEDDDYVLASESCVATPGEENVGMLFSTMNCIDEISNERELFLYIGRSL